MRFVDTQGRVDRFLQKMKTAEKKQGSQTQAKPKAISPEDVKSYKQLLQEQKDSLKASAKKTQAAA